MQAIIHQKVLILFVTNIRQLIIKDLTSSSWTVHIRNIIYKYDLPHALGLANDPPEKSQ